MPVQDTLREISERLGALGVLAEQRFLEIGRSLEQAVNIVDRLAATFGTLFAELGGPNWSRRAAILARQRGALARWRRGSNAGSPRWTHWPARSLRWVVASSGCTRSCRKWTFWH